MSTENQDQPPVNPNPEPECLCETGNFWVSCPICKSVEPAAHKVSTQEHVDSVEVWVPPGLREIPDAKAGHADSPPQNAMDMDALPDENFIAVTRALADLQLHAITYHINPLHGNYYLCKICNAESKESNLAIPHSEGCSITACATAIRKARASAPADNAQAVLHKKLDAIPKVWCAYCGKWSYHKSGYCPVAFKEFLDSVGFTTFSAARMEQFISTAFHDGWNEREVYSVGRRNDEQSAPLLSQNSPAVVPSVVAGVEEKLWTVERRPVSRAFIVKDAAETVIAVLDWEDDANTIRDAHNASLGEPGDGVEEKEDLELPEAHPESVEHVLQKSLTLVWRCSGWLDGLSDRLKELSPEASKMALYYSDALEALGERMSQKITSDLSGIAVLPLSSHSNAAGADQVSQEFNCPPKATQDSSRPSHFANWYALHGIPLGIGRENARLIYDSARGLLCPDCACEPINPGGECQTCGKKFLSEHSNAVLPHPVSESPVGSTAIGVSDEEIAREAAEACLSLDEPDDEWLITATKVILTAIRKSKSLSEPKEQKSLGEPGAI